MSTPAPDINSLLDQLQVQLSETIKERNELRAERTRLREVLQGAQLVLRQLPKPNIYVVDVINEIDIVLNDHKGPSE